MRLNKTNIRRVAMALLTGSLAKGKNPIGYNQKVYMRDAEKCSLDDNGGHSCGTVACIAGHAALLSGYRPKAFGTGNLSVDSRIRNRASKFLGVSDVMVSDLFQYNPLGYTRQPSASQAALVLFNLAETGKVNWKLVDSSYLP